jgi:hypothetical protein
LPGNKARRYDENRTVTDSLISDRAGVEVARRVARLVGIVAAALSAFPGRSDPAAGRAGGTQYGSAESPSGELRHLGQEEAEEVGLLSGIYQEVQVSGHLPKLLDGEI